LVQSFLNATENTSLDLTPAKRHASLGLPSVPLILTPFLPSVKIIVLCHHMLANSQNRAKLISRVIPLVRGFQMLTANLITNLVIILRVIDLPRKLALQTLDTLRLAEAYVERIAIRERHLVPQAKIYANSGVSYAMLMFDLILVDAYCDYQVIAVCPASQLRVG
jgi:hypothetical protein